MKHLKRAIELFLSLPKSFYVGLRLFGFKKAIRLPIIVRYNTRIISLSGSVLLMGGVELRLVSVKSVSLIKDMKGASSALMEI